jgi:hypothetical protein
MKKNTAGQFLSFAGINAATNLALAGAVVTARRMLDGVEAAATGAVTEPNSDGHYKFALSQADTNGNNCSYFFTAANMIPVCINMHTDILFPAGAITYTYTLTNSVTLLPVEGAEVWFSTDNVDPPTNIVWKGDTDVFGVARDVNGNLPALDAGTYYVWAQIGGYVANSWPDTEVVS